MAQARGLAGAVSTRKPRSWCGPLLALGFSLAVHGLLVTMLPEMQTPTIQPGNERTVNLEFHRPPKPAPEPDHAVVTAPNDPNIAPASESMEAPVVLEPPADALAVATESNAVPQPEPEPRVTRPPTPTLTPDPPASNPDTPLDDPNLVTRLLAAPLEDNPPPGPFDRAERVDPAPSGFRYPERESLLTMMTPALPELPFADPQLDVFMYAGGWQGDLHRGFDQITPEFGWRSNTGFEVRCRWVIIVVGCGWGRKQ